MYTTKNQINTNKALMEEMENNDKDTSKTKEKRQKFFFMSNYFKWIKLSN